LVTSIIWQVHCPRVSFNDTEMGRRREQRVQGILPVRISGTGRDGHAFREHVCTMEISTKGTRLAGVRADVGVGDILRIAYHHRTARFRIKWFAVAGNSLREIHVGVECLEPDTNLWPINLPNASIDHYESSDIYEDGSSIRRRHARFAISGKACVSKFGGSLGAWVKIYDISVSGCHLQRSETLNAGHRVTLLIRVADTEIEANGAIRSSDSMSMRVCFTYLTAAERRKLTRLVSHLEQNLIPRGHS
jgi:PilZ domain-containing protein